MRGAQPDGLTVQLFIAGLRQCVRQCVVPLDLVHGAGLQTAALFQLPPIDDPQPHLHPHPRPPRFKRGSLEA